MYTRIMRPDEREKMELIQTIAFEIPYEPKKPDQKEAPDDMKWWIAGDEGEAPYACVGILSTGVRFDGRIVPMGGVGGVATLPMHRRKGAIRACMSAALRDLYDTGHVFSSLYPFSRAYYRQYGFEDGASMSTWTIPFSALTLPEVGGSVELIMPGDDLGPVREVYAAAAGRWNLSAENCNLLKGWEKTNWMKDRRYMYLWRDPEGKPAGLIFFAKKDGIMDCTTTFPMPNALLFRDLRALIGLLRFAKGFAADYSAIRFTVPQGVSVQSLIGEGNDAVCDVKYNCMARLVNVRRALELCACRVAGSVNIAVSDGMIEENNGVWHVEFSPEGENRVEKTGAAPDVEMPVGELTQLLLGYRSAADIPMMHRVIVHSDAPLDGIFRPKTCHIMDLF